MTVMLDPLAGEYVAASSTGTFSFQPFIVLIFIGVILFSSFIKAANRKKREQRANPQLQAPPQQHPQANPAGRHGAAQQPTGAPYVGTLLNGIPLKSHDTLHGHQVTGFMNERMRAEAELKRQLDALDSARRNGQVTAEQYATHREAIFKKF